MMLRILFLVLPLLYACGTMRELKAQPMPVDLFIDPAGKAYLLLSDSRLVTRNKLGQTVDSFFDSSLGFPDHVDVTNPFSILLYYQDYGRLITLDRTLSEVSRKDLFAIEGLEQPGAIARANDNQIWVYDSWDYRLKLLDERGRIQLTSNNLRLELGLSDEPTAVYVDRGTVALLFKEANRLAVLTSYGRFQYWVDLPPTANITYLTPYLMGYDEQNSWRWVPGARTVRNYAQPQLKGDREIKRLATNKGYYRLDGEGRVTFLGDLE